MIAADEEMCPEKISLIKAISLLVRTVAARGKDIEDNRWSKHTFHIPPTEYNMSKIPGYYVLKNIRRPEKWREEGRLDRELRTQRMLSSLTFSF